MGRLSLGKVPFTVPGLKPETVGVILTGRARSDLRLCTWG